MTTAMIRVSPSILALFVLLGGVASVHSQEDSAGELSTDDEASAPIAPEKVDVEPVARDEQISQRLQAILDATEWFVKPQVEVQDGVVFFGGQAREERYRTWATDLAQRTQDVAAVVNRMTILKRPLWDFAPATTELRELSASIIQLSPLIAFGTLVVVLSWLLARGVKRLVAWGLRNRVSNGLLLSVAAQAAMVPVLLMGIYIVLRVSGLTQLALTVLGGTGIAGLIIGIAFRDIAENFLASILISTQNPFRTGDLVQVDTHTGYVQRVTTRGTEIMTLDGNNVQIPNAIIYKSTIINFTANPNRRVDFVVGIGYADSISDAQDTIKQELDKHPAVIKEPEARVILDNFGAATVNMRVYVWLDTSKHSPDAVRSSVMRLTKKALLERGISMPDEAREVVFPEQVPVRLIRDRIVHEERQQRRPAPAEPAPEPIVAAAEAGMENDAETIRRQGQRSWRPEEGENLLTDGDTRANRDKMTPTPPGAVLK
jgi:small-conductance mechanosensitive channel